MNAIRDEWRHITSGKFILLMLIVPILVAAAFGYIFQNGVMQDAPLAVVDLDHSTYSRQLIDKLNASQYVEVVDVFDNYAESDMLLYNEKYSGVLYLPSGTEASYAQGKAINLGLYLDMTMPTGASTARSGVSEVVGTENAAKGATSVLVVEQRTLYNPTSQTIMSSIMLFINVIMLAFLALNTLSVVPRLRQEEKLAGELKNPVGILLRAIPYAVITSVSFYMVIGIVKQVGGLRFEANIIELFVPLFLYGFSSSLMAMAIGWTARSTIHSAGRIVFIMLPSFLLSGVQVPYSLLPAPLQFINVLLPLSLHFKFLRGMGYKGGRLQYFVPELGHYLLIIALLSAILIILAFYEGNPKKAKNKMKEE
jgi:ABC-2 type transport system permease protein